MQMVRDGYSWSGSERNRLLLNCKGLRFADASSITGLDRAVDGRGLAMVDWDHDGDLDLWYRNRTAPRLQLMLNGHASGSDFVAVKLVGTTVNRDAIGAVVEVVTGAQRLVKSVRAGDLFLSQSSRWLHFGLGEHGGIDEVRVLWPGGKREVFKGASAGGAFALEEGKGTALRVDRSARQIGAGAPLRPAIVSAGGRVVLPARIPLPPIAYRDAVAKPGKIEFGAKPVFLMLWKASCPHCKSDFAAVVKGANRLRASGLDVVALSVDSDDVSEAYNLIDATQFPFRWGIIDPASLDRIDAFQRALFDVTVPISVPLAMLCDSDGSVLAIHRGRLDLDDVITDAKAARGADADRLHALAPPLRGRWFTNPVDPVYAVEFMAREMERRLPVDAMFYFETALKRATGDRAVVLCRETTDKHHALARRFKVDRDPRRAAVHFERALALEPRAVIHLDYGTMLASYGDLVEARKQLEQALALQPDFEAARQALKWVEKLSDSP